MPTTDPTPTPPPTRGEYIETLFGHARYVGTRDAVDHVAYDGEDFDAVCRGFDDEVRS